MLTRYERSGASSRLRLIQYAGSFRAEGIESSLHPFFSENYLSRLYAGQSTRSPALAAYARRAAQLWQARRADLIWLEKEALPWLPWPIERTLLPRGVPLVLDYDDAVFHRYDLHRRAAVRRLLGHKLDRLMASAALVTAGNRYLADRAIAAGAARVEIVPTVVDMDVYTRRPAADTSPVIGWIGTPSTWTEYMAPMMPLLARAASQAGARIAAVGPGRAAAAHPLLDNLPWTEESEVARIHAMDIGVMPLTDTPWSRGKCGYKLIQYMGCSLPVVASPVGVNREIVEHGRNGFLADTPAAWEQALGALVDDAALRERLGAAGRAKVVRAFSVQANAPLLLDALRTAAQVL